MSDSLDEAALLLPDELLALVEMMKTRGSYSGSNTELAEQINASSGVPVSAKGLKQMMNKYQGQLERAGVWFQSTRSNGQRFVRVSFFSPETSAVSDGSDAESAGDNFCAPCGTCDPVTLCGA